MDDLTVIQHWIQHHTPPLWVVVVAAVAFAWFDHTARLRRMRRYDGWLFNNLRRSDLKLLRRARRL